MLLYPALATGFLFVGVPLLVHLINLLRHRRTQWSAMDFLLASYRKQRKWIVLRQLLLLLTRIAVAALLISVLAGLIGGRKLLGTLGGQTTHHVVVLDDSYSMRQSVGRDASLATQAALSDGGQPSARSTSQDREDGFTAYDRALQTLASLVRRLASEDGNHQLTVMRASRAAMVSQSTGGTADTAADLSAQSVTGDGRQIDRLMSSRASSLRTDLVPAIDLASDLIRATPADVKSLYVISDFTRRDWSAPRRIAQSLEKADESGAKIRMIDCAQSRGGAAQRSLAVTDLSPTPDVWVAGVPVTMNVTVKNYSPREVKNIALTTSVITYGKEVTLADPTATISGNVQSLPAIMIESIPGGQQLTKSFQVYIDREGTHVVRISLPDDALSIDNTRVCTIPLVDAQRVLVIDGDPDGLGAYYVSSVLDPGSQVRIGAIPDVQPAAMLRDMSLETLKRYRAVYLIDVPQVSKRSSEVLAQYVREGGGLAWFLGDDVDADNYNEMLRGDNRNLIPYPLQRISREETAASLGLTGPDGQGLGQAGEDASASKLVMGDDASALGPIAQAGNGIFSLVNLQGAWLMEHSQHAAVPSIEPTPPSDSRDQTDASPKQSALVQTMLARGDGIPIAMKHELGLGRIVTVATGLDGRWNNWPGDPTFVVFLLQTNAMLFSGAAPPTSRFIDSTAEVAVPAESYMPTATLLPPAAEPPRLSIELEATKASTSGEQSTISILPRDLVISDQSGLDELLMPGIAEWQRIGTDGQTSVLPMASVLRVGESDLARVTPAEVMRDLMPLEVEFVSSANWARDSQVGGMSTFLLLLLGLLALLLGLEQALAAWASYHAKPSSRTAPESTHHPGVGRTRHTRATHRTTRSSLSDSPVTSPLGQRDASSGTTVGVGK